MAQSQTESKSNHDTGVYEIFKSQIYLSSFKPSTEIDNLKHIGITTIINVTKTCPTKDQYFHFNVLHLPMKDEVWYDLIPGIKACALYIDSLLKDESTLESNSNSNKIHKKQHRVLVHCSAGQSRSVSVILGYCMIYKKMSLLNAYNHIKSIKKDVFPNVGFMKQLAKLEMQLFDINKTTIDLYQHGLNGLISAFYDPDIEQEIKKAHNGKDKQDNQDKFLTKEKIEQIYKKCNGDLDKSEGLLLEFLSSQLESSIK